MLCPRFKGMKLFHFKKKKFSLRHATIESLLVLDKVLDVASFLIYCLSILFADSFLVVQNIALKVYGHTFIKSHLVL